MENYNKIINNKRLLGVDYGSINIGLAISETDSLHVSSLGIYKKAQGKAERKILEFIEKEKIEIIVVGYPLDAKDTRTKKCNEIDIFCRRIKRRSSVEIFYQDEFMSSEEAKEYLANQGKFNQFKEIDDISAIIILKRFLADNHRAC